MLAAIGLNHHRSPISVREQFALHKQELKDTLIRLKNKGISELAILSTCNRTEIYCHTQDYSPITDWLATTGNIPISKLKSHIFIAPSRDAVKHIYRVASGLDSIIIGEANIFGQIKDAVRTAQESKTLGTTLHKLFQTSFAVAKEIRSSTEIGHHGISIASVAIQISEKIFGDLSDTNIMFIGTGEMIELCASHFSSRRPKNIMVISRNSVRSKSFADRFGGEHGDLSVIGNNLSKFDIIISCTESNLPIISAEMVQGVIKSRKYRPMMMVDLGVPRNIEPKIKTQNDVFLYSVDDLHEIIYSHIGHRQKASQQAEIIIDARVDDFMRYIDHRKAVNLIKEFKKSIKNISENEVKKALRKIENGSNPSDVLLKLTNNLGNKFLHPWISQLNKAEGKHFDELLNFYQVIIEQTQKSKRK